MAVMSAISRIDTISLSEGTVSVSDIDAVEAYVYENLFDYQSDRFSITDYRLDFIMNSSSCEYGYHSDYPFFHIVMKVGIKRIANSDDINMITIHMDVEVPVDR